jgi:hypothetical protein
MSSHPDRGNRRQFYTANTEDKVTAAAAISGLKKPSAATGNASRL